jgi:hypothetical protein
VPDEDREHRHAQGQQVILHVARPRSAVRFGGSDSARGTLPGGPSSSFELTTRCSAFSSDSGSRTPTATRQSLSLNAHTDARAAESPSMNARR